MGVSLVAQIIKDVMEFDRGTVCLFQKGTILPGKLAMGLVDMWGMLGSAHGTGKHDG